MNQHPDNVVMANKLDGSFVLCESLAKLEEIVKSEPGQWAESGIEVDHGRYDKDDYGQEGYVFRKEDGEVNFFLVIDAIWRH